jgi:hypothetical protein
MTQPHPQPNPNELLSITREELERCCSQMSAAGYKVSANYVEAMVLSRSSTHTPAAPAMEYTIEQIAEIDNRIRKERKAEREQVLEEFKWMKPQCFGNHDACCDTKCAWVVRKRCIESLRGGGAP